MASSKTEYICDSCNMVLVRDSTKARIKSWCTTADKVVYIRRIDKEDDSG